MSITTALAEQLTSQLSRNAILRANEPLARHTTLRVGGPADWYLEPANEADLAQILTFCREHALTVFIMGRGSNLLASDAGFRGVVVCLAHPGFCQVNFDGCRVRCGAGLRLKTLAVEARRNEVAGFEFLEGIPGSVGGALRMNAGAMGSATFELVESVRVMGLDGHVEELAPAQMDVGYRHCKKLEQALAVSAVFLGKPGKRQEIDQRMNEFSRKRWSSQPAAPSAGCMFKNPASLPAGKLIDELGLKGTRVGGARISLEHGNFLVNEGTATARDILELIELIRRKARQERGIELEPEVQILGA